MSRLASQGLRVRYSALCTFQVWADTYVNVHSARADSDVSFGPGDEVELHILATHLGTPVPALIGVVTGVEHAPRSAHTSHAVILHDVCAVDRRIRDG